MRIDIKSHKCFTKDHHFPQNCKNTREWIKHASLGFVREYGDVKYEDGFLTCVKDILRSLYNNEHYKARLIWQSQIQIQIQFHFLIVLFSLAYIVIGGYPVRQCYLYLEEVSD